MQGNGDWKCDQTVLAIDYLMYVEWHWYELSCTSQRDHNLGGLLRECMCYLIGYSLRLAQISLEPISLSVTWSYLDRVFFLQKQSSDRFCFNFQTENPNFAGTWVQARVSSKIFFPH